MRFERPNDGSKFLLNPQVVNMPEGQNKTILKYTQERRSLNCGVPQGTVLGPILFLIYINDLERCVSNSCLESFADDSKLLKAISCMDDTALLQQDLVNVSQWSQENSMVLHDRKFELLCHLSDKDNSLHQLPFTSELYNYTTSNSVTISPSPAVKDLGVIISSDLSWQRHISTMVGNATKMSAWALSLFQDRSKVTMLTLYKSMVRCRLEYCCPLSYGTLLT